MSDPESKMGYWLRLKPPGSVSDLVKALRQNDTFPAEKTWWFAWQGLEIELPQVLTDVNQLAGAWETVRVFSATAELRIQQRGGQPGYWLLTEDGSVEAVKKRYQDWLEGELQLYQAEKGQHLLAGQRLGLPGNVPNAQAEERGELIYPRPLNYGLGPAKLSEAVVAEVWHYYDAQWRRVTARYAGLKTVPVKAENLPVQRFREPDAVFTELTN